MSSADRTFTNLDSTHHTDIPYPVATERFKDAVSSPVSLDNASELLSNIQKPLAFRDILERRLTITEGRYYLPSLSFSEDFEAQSFQDWLAFFEQDKDPFMEYAI